MFTLRNNSINLGLAVVIVASAFFVTRVELSSWLGRLSAASVLLLAIPCARALVRWLGRRDTVLVIGVIGLLAIVIETLAIVTEFPYGPFGYSEFLTTESFSITALTIAFCWIPMVLGSYALAANLTANRLFCVVILAILLTAADFAINPGAVSLGFWQYTNGGDYLGMPVSNFLGSLLPSLIGGTVLELMLSRMRPLLPAPVQLASSLILIVSFWTAVAAFELMIAPAVIGLVLLVGFGFLFVINFYAFDEMVVLVDAEGNTIGTANKYVVHDSDTPLHKAFSVFLINSQGELLLQRRALTKKTWPGVWSNSCCGHQMLHEPIEAAARRRLRVEIGITSAELHLILPNYRYRAEKDGIVENEVCPVFVAFSDQDPRPNPSEVGEIGWVPWNHARQMIVAPDSGFSPWAIEEIDLLLADESCTRLIADRTRLQCPPLRAAA